VWAEIGITFKEGVAAQADAKAWFGSKAVGTVQRLNPGVKVTFEMFVEWDPPHRKWETGKWHK
jgi:hypothetical protein